MRRNITGTIADAVLKTHVLPFLKRVAGLIEYDRD